MNEDTAIKVKSLNKIFKLPHEKHNSVKGMLINLGRSNKGYEKQHVLKNINFEVKKGEFFGIVGRNGSGKSTLLKLLAGIYYPSSGSVQINGKLTPFIELGVGFNPELTGRENVFLNGALLGFSRKEMLKKYSDIVEFAELARFMDQKLKNYSSGMQVRLAFSIAIQARSDILLLDEVLAVGDAAFQRKCFEYFGELKRKKQTVIFITHDMGSVRKYCDRGILIDNGVVKLEGSTEEIINEYSKLFIENNNEKHVNSELNEIPLGMAPTSKLDRRQFDIGRVWVTANGKKVNKKLSNEISELQVNLEVFSTGSEKEFIPGIIFQNNQGEFITATNSEWAKEPIRIKLKKGAKTVVTFEMPNIYEEGDYKLSCNIVSADSETFYDWKNQGLKLFIERKSLTGAKAYPEFKVRSK